MEVFAAKRTLANGKYKNTNGIKTPDCRPLRGAREKRKRKKTDAIFGLCRAGEKQRHIQVLVFKELKRKVGNKS